MQWAKSGEDLGVRSEFMADFNQWIQRQTTLGMREPVTSRYWVTYSGLTVAIKIQY